MSSKQREAFHKEKCHCTVLNIYRLLNGERQTQSHDVCSSILQQLLETEKCQDFHDLRLVREATVEKLEELSPSKPFSINAALDEDTCSKVVDRFGTLYEQNILQTLRWSTRAHYICEMHKEKLALASSLTVGGVFGVLCRSPSIGVAVAGVTEGFWKLFKK